MSLLRPRFGGRRWHRLVAGLFRLLQLLVAMRLFRRHLLSARFQLVDTPLLLRQRGDGRLILARTLAAVAVAIPPAAVATATVPAMLIAFALRPRGLRLDGGLMERWRVAGGRGLLRPRLLGLLRRALLLSALISPIGARSAIRSALRSAIGSRPALGPSILALALAVALLAIAAAATLLEPAMLLAVAAATFAAVASLVTSSIAAAVAALLLVAALIALLLLCLDRRRGGRCSRGRPWLEET